MKISVMKPSSCGFKFLFFRVLLLLSCNAAADANLVEQVHNAATTTFNNSLSPNGQRIYFTEVGGDPIRVILKEGIVANGKVTSVNSLRIGDMEVDGTDIHISPDGEQLLYSARSAFQAEGDLEDYNLYVSTKTKQGWSWPKALPTSINSDADEFYPSLASNGNLYFSRRIEGQNLDLFVSEYVDGQYLEAKRLGDAVNTEGLEGDGFIDPEENYLIFARMKAKDSMGMTDLYISYREGNSWSPARNMGQGINSAGIDGSPFVSRDGRWLYFTSNREGDDPEKFDNSLGLYRLPFGPQPVIQDTSSIDYGGSLSPDSTELFYTNASEGFKKRQLMRAKIKDGQVVARDTLLLGGEVFEGSDIQVSPSGNTLLFKTRKNFGSLTGRTDGNIYWSQKTGSGWAHPTALPKEINSSNDEYYPVLTQSGNLYFSRQIEGKSYDIFVAKFQDGKYQEARALPAYINTEILESDAYVAPDESFLLFVRIGEGLGVSDLFISFNEDGDWTLPVNLGPLFNFEGVDGSPFVTADKKWLYFTSNRTSTRPSVFDSHLGIYRISLPESLWES